MDITEFLQDGNGKGSSGRLLAFGAWFVSSMVLIFFNHTTEAYGVYLGTWGSVFVGGKFADKNSKPA